MSTQYQVLIVIESVELDDHGDNIPDSRIEDHHELIELTNSMEHAYDVVNALIDAKDSIERISQWLNQNKNN